MKDFLLFRRMIAPITIQILFWLGALGSIGAGAVLAINSRQESAKLLGAGAIVLGPLAVRLLCEILILFFRMNETLTDIKRASPRTP